MTVSPTFSSDSTADEVATVFAAEIEGKNVLITGTSINGIGFDSARAIAKYAKLVVITGYNAERLQLSADTIKKEFPTANIRTLILDLSSLAGVRKAAETVNTYPEPLHVLIHNAAAAIAPLKLTVDHVESQLATDHVGPFLFTKLLTPKLLASATSTYTPRVVFVASLAHAFGTGVDLDFLARPDPEKYTMSQVYFQAKSANILTAIELSKRAKGRLNAYSLHPGVVDTNMVHKEDSVEELKAMGMLTLDGKPNREKWEWKTVPQGAATTVAAAFDPSLVDKPGAFLDNSLVANESVVAHSSDLAISAKLWQVTEDIIGETFTFDF